MQYGLSNMIVTIILKFIDFKMNWILFQILLFA